MTEEIFRFEISTDEVPTEMDLPFLSEPLEQEETPVPEVRRMGIQPGTATVTLGSEKGN